MCVYMGDICIVSIKENRVEVMPATCGKIWKTHIADVNLIFPIDKIIPPVPDYQSFDHKTKLHMSPDHIHDLSCLLSSVIKHIITAVPYSLRPCK